MRLTPGAAEFWWEGEALYQSFAEPDEGRRVGLFPERT